MITAKHFVGGQWLDGDEHVMNKSPGDGREFCRYPVAHEAEVEAAVQHAHRAQAKWAELTIDERCSHVTSLIEVMREAYAQTPADSIRGIIHSEIGKPVPEADIEVLESIDFAEYFVKIAPSSLKPDLASINESLWPTKQSIVYHKPFGVVAIVKPWNYPLELIIWALVPAILSGNTAVIKSSERSPGVTFELAKFVARSGIPSGVINIIFGDARTGQLLISNQSVSCVTFTGSSAVGRKVAGICAQALKPCNVELGGNDAALVLDDADLETAAGGLVWGAFCNAGQVCVGIKRAYVHEDVFDALLPKIVEKVNALREGVDYGPLIGTDQLEEVEKFIHSIRGGGGTIVSGGERGSAGCYFRPTVAVIQNEISALLDCECFGPFLPLMRVGSLDEAIDAANNSDFGLGASIWSSDLSKAREAASRLNCGMVWINDVNVAFPETPWGGVKASGSGYELSVRAFGKYSYPQHVSVETNVDEKRRPWWYPYE